MEYFLQYVHSDNDSNHLILLDDEPEVLLINNQPLVNFTFKEDKLYYITFSIKTKPIAQSFKIRLVNLKNNQIDEQNDIQLVDNFQIPANEKEILRGCSCLFSPTSQIFDGIIFENLNINNQLILENIKIYQVHKINFFENQQDELVRRITKISVLGEPNTLVAINNKTLRIGIDKNLQLSHNFIVTSVGVASTKEFTINLMYEIVQ